MALSQLVCHVLASWSLPRCMSRNLYRFPVQPLHFLLFANLCLSQLPSLRTLVGTRPGGSPLIGSANLPQVG